jgi:hypothetical protein
VRDSHDAVYRSVGLSRTGFAPTVFFLSPFWGEFWGEGRGGVAIEAVYQAWAFADIFWS